MDDDLDTAEVVVHESAEAFLLSCGPWLSQKEDINHGLISLADALRSNRHIHRPPFLFCHVELNANIAGCSIYAEPDGIVISEMPDKANVALYTVLRERIELPSRIFGPLIPAMRLAERFAQSGELVAQLESEWLVHRLDEQTAQVPSTPGKLVLGNIRDREIVSRWGRDYNAEKPSNINVEKFLLRKLDDQLLYFWSEIERKSLATISGTICSGPRISAVYTPHSCRGAGYASALVHELAQKFLTSGSPYITLNTRVGDGVEYMYEKLGFRIIGKKANFVFRQ